MRRVQAAALDLFEERGFSAVSVEDIAREAGVGPASVYRYFATKERIVLWDEYDPMLLTAIERELVGKSPIDAVVAALGEALDEVYARDRKRILRRSRLVLNEPSIAAASRTQMAELRHALSDLFGGDLAADVSAAAIVATLEVVVTHWVRAHGKIPFRRIARDAFRALKRGSASGRADGGPFD
jgi:AcrR family transcriptional regulator